MTMAYASSSLMNGTRNAIATPSWTATQMPRGPPGKAMYGTPPASRSHAFLVYLAKNRLENDSRTAPPSLGAKMDASRRWAAT